MGGLASGLFTRGAGRWGGVQQAGLRSGQIAAGDGLGESARAGKKEKTEKKRLHEGVGCGVAEGTAERVPGGEGVGAAIDWRL